MRNIYYAHCMDSYYTPQESNDVKMLSKLGFNVINPSDKHYTSDWKSHGMAYADKLLKNCKALAFRKTRNGKIGAGVGYEIELAIRLGLPVIEIPSVPYGDVMTREETRAYILSQKNVDWYRKRIKGQ